MATVVTALVLDLSPIPIDVCITRRDSFTYGVIFEDANGPIDFTGDSFLHTVNPQDDGGGTDVFAIANNNTLDATGLVTFSPSIADLTENPGDFFHDMQWTRASNGDVRTMGKGKYTIGKDISD